MPVAKPIEFYAHGTRTRYRRGCKCALCREAENACSRAQRAGRGSTTAAPSSWRKTSAWEAMDCAPTRDELMAMRESA